MTDHASLALDNTGVHLSPMLASNCEQQGEMTGDAKLWADHRYLGKGAVVLVMNEKVTLGSNIECPNDVGNGDQAEIGLPVLDIRGVGDAEGRVLKVLLNSWGQPVQCKILNGISKSGKSIPNNLRTKTRRDPTLGPLLRTTGTARNPEYFFADACIFDPEKKENIPRIVHLRLPSPMETLPDSSKSPHLTIEELQRLETTVLCHIVAPDYFRTYFEVPKGYIYHPRMVWSGMKAAMCHPAYKGNKQASDRLSILNRQIKNSAQ